MAAHDHRDSRGAVPARRRRDDEQGRTPEIYADAAYVILTQPAREYTGQTLIDDEVLAEAGITDLERYRAGRGGGELIGDLFVDDAPLRQG